MRVSGRRVFPRFRTFGAWLGQLRISKQVAVDLTEPGLTVISDSPGVVDEEFSLALVYGGRHVDVKVRVVATSPQVLEGVLRHQLKLDVLDDQSASTDLRVWTR
jgi:hypothetical protein